MVSLRKNEFSVSQFNYDASMVRARRLSAVVRDAHETDPYGDGKVLAGLFGNSLNAYADYLTAQQYREDYA